MVMNVANMEAEMYFKRDVCMCVFFCDLKAWFLRVNLVNDK